MVNHTQDFVAVKKYEILQYSLIPTGQTPAENILGTDKPEYLIKDAGRCCDATTSCLV